ncbi:putative Cyclin-like superfamily, cyclin/Cyclin-like subunit Ssn8 [Helianthus anomalus]
MTEIGILGYVEISLRLCSSLWLQLKPHQIAVGAAYLAITSLDMDLFSCQNTW